MMKTVLQQNLIQVDHTLQHANPGYRETCPHAQEPCKSMFGAALLVVRTVKTNQKSIKSRIGTNKFQYIPPAMHPTAVKMIKPTYTLVRLNVKSIRLNGESKLQKKVYNIIPLR